MDDDFAAQLAIAAKMNQQNGQSQMANAVLAWANEPTNKLKLRTVGLIDSLVKVCTEVAK